MQFFIVKRLTKQPLNLAEIKNEVEDTAKQFYIIDADCGDVRSHGQPQHHARATAVLNRQDPPAIPPETINVFAGAVGGINETVKMAHDAAERPYPLATKKNKNCLD